MAAIHSKDTKPEMIVRRWLWSRGFRYRLNHRRLPGKPDIVMRKYKVCIFINGCFWHGHNCQRETGLQSSACCKIPKTNREFWEAKIERNMERDEKVKRKLLTMGWHTMTIWECELKPTVRQRTFDALERTLNQIFLYNNKVKIYAPEEEATPIAAEARETKYSKTDRHREREP